MFSPSSNREKGENRGRRSAERTNQQRSKQTTKRKKVWAAASWLLMLRFGFIFREKKGGELERRRDERTE